MTESQPTKHPGLTLTIARMMLLVAFTGIVLGGFCLHRRHEFALGRVKHHEQMAELVMASSLREWDSMEADRVRGHHERLVVKWQAAAERPWSPFEADPPAPEWSIELEREFRDRRSRAIGR